MRALRVRRDILAADPVVRIVLVVSGLALAGVVCLAQLSLIGGLLAGAGAVVAALSGLRQRGVVTVAAALAMVHLALARHPAAVLVLVTVVVLTVYLAAAQLAEAGVRVGPRGLSALPALVVHHARRGCVALAGAAVVLMVGGVDVSSHAAALAIVLAALALVLMVMAVFARRISAAGE